MAIPSLSRGGLGWGWVHRDAKPIPILTFPLKGKERTYESSFDPILTFPLKGKERFH